MTAFNVKVQRVSRGIFDSDMSSVFEQCHAFKAAV